MASMIDFHIHPPGPGGTSTKEQEEMAAYFKGGPPPKTIEEVVEYYERIDTHGVIFAIDSETISGRAPVPNDYIADCVRRWPENPLQRCAAAWKGWSGSWTLRRRHRAGCVRCALWKCWSGPARWRHAGCWRSWPRGRRPPG